MTSKTCLTLLITAVTVLMWKDGARGSESLYRSDRASKLTATQQGLFGPQSSKFKYDKRMVRAAEIAAARARGRSISR